MIIIIPMAGASSRFYNAGYTMPKYMLPLGGETVFDKSVSSFKKYFKTTFFIFIIRGDDLGAYEFVDEHCQLLGISKYHISILPKITRGQAETVFEGVIDTLKSKDKDFSIEEFSNIFLQYRDELVIFNIDTIRKNLEIPIGNYSSYFDAFYDENADETKWSFGEVAERKAYLKSDTTKFRILPKYYLIRTAEKEKISNWCSTGLYIFGFASSFFRAYLDAIKDPNYNFYIAPLYNYLIPDSTRISSNYLLECPREDVEFSGVPSEYEALKIKYSNEEKI